MTEIRRQLSALQEGGVSPKDFEASKKSLADTYRGIGDTPEGLDAWYGSQMLFPRLLSPEEYVRRIDSVTLEQVIRASGKVTLDTIYILAGEEENHDHE